MRPPLWPSPDSAEAIKARNAFSVAEDMALAWDGFDSDTKEALRVVRADSRAAFYRPSKSRKLLGGFAAVVAFALILAGFAMAEPINYAFILAGVLVLEVVAASFAFRS